MRRSTLLTLVVAALSAAPASAHGHLRGPVEVRYYYPSPVYVVPPYRPVYVAPPTYVMPTAPVLVPSAPVLPTVPAVAMPAVATRPLPVSSPGDGGHRWPSRDPAARRSRAA